MEIKIHKNYITNSVDIFIFDEKDNKYYIAKPINLEFEEMDGFEIQEPTLRFRALEGTEFLNNLAQALIDAGMSYEIADAMLKERER